MRENAVIAAMKWHLQPKKSFKKESSPILYAFGLKEKSFSFKS
jgi:hypothetical protein